jgi:hypothetical protein
VGPSRLSAITLALTPISPPIPCILSPLNVAQFKINRFDIGEIPNALHTTNTSIDWTVGTHTVVPCGRLSRQISLIHFLLVSSTASEAIPVELLYVFDFYYLRKIRPI